jgi:hypothetical protein
MTNQNAATKHLRTLHWMLQAKLAFAACHRGLDALRNQLSLLFCERGVNVQCEVITVFAECRNDEVHFCAQ